MTKEDLIGTWKLMWVGKSTTQSPGDEDRLQGVLVYKDDGTMYTSLVALNDVPEFDLRASGYPLDGFNYFNADSPVTQGKGLVGFYCAYAAKYKINEGPSPNGEWILQHDVTYMSLDLRALSNPPNTKFLRAAMIDKETKLLILRPVGGKTYLAWQRITTVTVNGN
jgi:hypothetical protein